MKPENCWYLFRKWDKTKKNGRGDRVEQTVHALERCARFASVRRLGELHDVSGCFVVCMEHFLEG